MRTAAMLAMILCCGVANAETALNECWRQSANHQEASACLRSESNKTEAALAQAARAMRAEMARLDSVTGRNGAVDAFDASQAAFEQYRERTCAWIAAAAAGGSGTGDMALDCMIRLTRQRTAELEAQMPEREAGPEPAAPAVPAVLSNVDWHLSALEEAGVPIALPQGATATFRLGADGRVTGRAPINAYFGEAKLDADGDLSWKGPMGSTQMAGAPELMDAEAAYFRIVQGSSRWRLVEGELMLESVEGGSSARFRQ